MSHSKYLLHLSLGPVQGFVAQSRRTRDLWASSWLLSRLSGEAMKAALSSGSGASLVLPAYETAQLEKCFEREHGGLPNRFVVSFAREEEAVIAGGWAKKAIKELWQSIANDVWERFLKDNAASGNGTAGIWKRQIDNFWEMAWVVSPNDPERFSALDERKNWRSTPAAVEPGNHCSSMPQLQELSGWIAPEERTNQKAFWDGIRLEVGNLDLARNEQLCAIALIKRLFPKLPRFDNLKTLSWPSTVYLAAVPWLEEAAAKAASDDAFASTCADYVELAKRSMNENCSSEGQSRVHFERADEAKALGWFPALDGNFFNPTALANENGTPLKNDDNGEKRQALVRALYSPSFFRLKREVSLLAGVSGLPVEVKLDGQIPFGGESRTAIIEELGEPIALPDSPDNPGKRRAVILLTPLPLPTRAKLMTQASSGPSPKASKKTTFVPNPKRSPTLSG